MEITINVNLNAPDLVKSIQSLAAALAVSQAIQPATITPPTSKPESTTKPSSKQKPKEEVTPNTTAQEPETPPITETPQTETTENPKVEITLEEVRSKLAQLSQSGKQAQVKELITKFGATKLTEIPAEKYADLLVEAEAIA